VPSAPRSPEIDQLMGLGAFSRAQAEEALTVCNGDLDGAAAYLFV